MISPDKANCPADFTSYLSVHIRCIRDYTDAGSAIFDRALENMCYCADIPQGAPGV